MQIELIQNGRVLRQIAHNGQNYIEAPPEGTYEIRLTNNSPHRRLAVVTIDGVNINDGKDGSFDGSGYAMAAWQSFTLKGWLRSNNEVAAFEFKPNEASYAAGTGRGTKNTGVIGVAVFDEKPKPVIFQPPPVIIREEHHHHHHDHYRWPRTYPWVTYSSNSGDVMRGGDFSTTNGFTPESSTLDSDRIFTLCSDSGPVAAAAPMPASASVESSQKVGATQRGADGKFKSKGATVPRRRSLDSDSMELERERGIVDLGTGYGQRVTQYTTTVEFERATTTPAFVIVLRYAVTKKLEEWGVPLSQTVPPPQAFPASPGFAPPPPGWRG